MFLLKQQNRDKILRRIFWTKHLQKEDLYGMKRQQVFSRYYDVDATNFRHVYIARPQEHTLKII
jgi:hypothetical protein